MTRSARLLGIIAILLICVESAQGQTSGKIPEAWKTSLKTRLDLFVKSQADGKWEEVKSVLGPYRKSGSLVRYSEHHKDCLIKQMRSMPMISFEMKKSLYSTQILSAPMAKRWWYLDGDAVFKTAEGERRQASSVVAYRYNDQWYFTPPNYDEIWSKAHTTEAELQADHADEIVIHNNPKAPLQISDLHAFINRKYQSLLNLKFALTNVSDQKITSFKVLLYTKGGSGSFSTGTDLRPNGSVEVTKLDSSRYLYACDDTEKHTLIVESVTFADGSEWNTSEKR